MALSNAARRAIAIRNSIKRRAQNDNTPKAANDNGRNGRGRRMSAAELAACLEASGFEQNAYC